MTDEIQLARTRWGAVCAVLRRTPVAGDIGEDVPQLDHALQTAALARDANAPDGEILAALLHDIGHLLDEATDARLSAPEGAGDLGAADHEIVGARFLAENGFGCDVTDLVRSHVQAKRYLVHANASYRARLSDASTHTLELQGGPMTPAQARDFEGTPHFAACLRLRSWDERAKVPDAVVPPLDAYTAMAERHLLR